MSDLTLKCYMSVIGGNKVTVNEKDVKLKETQVEGVQLYETDE